MPSTAGRSSKSGMLGVISSKGCDDGAGVTRSQMCWRFVSFVPFRTSRSMKAVRRPKPYLPRLISRPCCDWSCRTLLTQHRPTCMGKDQLNSSCTCSIRSIRGNSKRRGILVTVPILHWSLNRISILVCTSADGTKVLWRGWKILYL
jgi:hypothetical protein